ELRPGVLADRLVADGAVGLKVTVSAGTPGVHHPLRNPLPVEVADLLDEVVILERGRPARANRALVLVVINRVALPGRQFGLLARVLRRGMACALPVRHAVAHLNLLLKGTAGQGWPCLHRGTSASARYRVVPGLADQRPDSDTVPAS